MSENDPTALVVDPDTAVPNDGRLSDDEHPPAPLVVEPDEAGCECDEDGEG